MKLLFLIFAVFTATHVDAAASRACQRYLAKMQARAQGDGGQCFDETKVFLTCLTGSIEDSVEHVIAEADSDAQDEASQCFSAAGCGNVKYSVKAALDAFVPCDSADVENDCLIRHAAQLVIDILEGVPKSVGKCMIKYFKGIGARKIEQCHKDYPVKGRVDFKMPEIPGFEDFEVKEIKNLIIYHLMTRHSLIKCKACPVKKDAKSLVKCLTKSVKDEDASGCHDRITCENEIPSSCKSFYEKVQASTCACVVGEVKKGVAAVNDWTELKEMLTKGDWKCQFELCYGEAGRTNDWKQMNKKINTAKRAIIKAFLKYRKGGLPRSMLVALEVFKNILDELVLKWGGVFCGSCNEPEIGAADARKSAYNKLIKGATCEVATPPPRQRGRGGRPRPRPTPPRNDEFDSFFGDK